ncbi:MAG: 2,3-bisphosphoglycerate-independent phosphoglycerate mutase, partial [Eubacterium sp.]|nr:2,3-bisphosphoglycerate-independent phosphoglycerate mutase [Eubacterium sp.]
LLHAIENAKKNNGTLHLWGLLSDGGVHSHNTHLYALLEMAKKQGLEDVCVHCFLDGRDTPPTSGIDYIKELIEKMNEIGVGRIGVISGRYYAMDRDNRWEREEIAYKALTLGVGVDGGTDPVAALQASYDNEVTDEFVVPIVMKKEDGTPVATVKDGDSVIFYNFRPDRAREITRAFCDPEFTGFARERLENLTYVCFKDYDETIPNKLVAFKKEEITNTFAQYLSSLGKTQLHTAETEKYAHVTFFFNGGIEEPYPGEDRILVNSPKVPTYDMQPEMSAYEVCDNLCEAIRSKKYDVIIINFANPDMVGHTGVEEAAIKAIEAVDECVGRAVEAVKETGAQMFICADHGNAEYMVDEETGDPFTAHTTNPVPFILVNADPSWSLKEGGRLADIVPTLLDMMNIPQPKEMTGVSLLNRG